MTNSSETTAFNYNALGQRTSRASGGETEVAHYGDLSDVPTFDTAGGGEILRSYVTAWPTRSASTALIDGIIQSQASLPNASKVSRALALASDIGPIQTQAGTTDPAGLIEERQGGEITYPLSDAHGDITAVIDQSGSVISRHTYDPWGVPTSTNTRQMGYLGAYLRRRDPDSGLLQMGARQYDPRLGRFLSEDPVLGFFYLGQSWNRHSYVVNRPLVLYDLDGFTYIKDCIEKGLDSLECSEKHKGISIKVPGPLKKAAELGGLGVCSLYGPPGVSMVCRVILGKKAVNAGRSIQLKDIVNVAAGCASGVAFGLSTGLALYPLPPQAKAAAFGAYCVGGAVSEPILGVNPFFPSY